MLNALRQVGAVPDRTRRTSRPSCGWCHHLWEERGSERQTERPPSATACEFPLFAYSIRPCIPRRRRLPWQSQILGPIENFIVNTKSGKLSDVLVSPAENVPMKGMKTDPEGRLVLPFQGMKAVKDVVVMNL